MASHCLLAMPGAPSSVLAPSSDGQEPLVASLLVSNASSDARSP